MKLANIFLSVILVFNFICLPAFSRPGESIDAVLKRLSIEGEKPVTQEDYVSYKVNYERFVSKPTVFFKLGANGIILEENFLFDKNTVHEKDVQRAKGDTRPTVAIPHQAYLVGDFSQLPRESFNTKSKVIGGFAAPLGACVGTFAGAGKGLYEGTKIGVKTADSASRALGGDVSGRAAAWAASATSVATGAITGLFAGFTGGAVEGSVRGARVGVEGISGADRKITEAIPADSNYVIIGGRIGKELSPDEQKSLLDKLSKLEQTRLANESLDMGKDKGLAESGIQQSPPPQEEPSQDKDKGYLSNLDTASEKNPLEESSNYLPEDSKNKNVAGMW